MAMVLSEDQQLLRDSARSFCQDNAPISVMRRLRDEKSELGYDEAIWQQMIELGWPGMAIAEKYGGFEFGYTGLGLVLEETGRTLASSPLIASVLLGASLLSEAGNEEQKSQLLPQIVNGKMRLAVGVDEGPHHNPSRVACTAIKKGAEYVLTGAKSFVLDGHIADKLIVAARTSGEPSSENGISLFLLEAGCQGLQIQRTQMVDSRNAANLVLNQVRISEDSLLGSEGAGFTALDAALDIARIGVASEMLGSVQEVFQRIVEYLKQREQFGVQIGAFQALQHRAAEIYSEIELCKSAVLGALRCLDDPSATAKDRACMASLAKAKLSEVSERVSNEGIQMHGGIGMTDEFDIGFFLKRARVAQQFLGDASFHRDRYATLHNF
ncbi:MAG: acyl-CoA dehydrogenase family protein [Pseudohongiellaceae bacterium]